MWVSVVDQCSRGAHATRATFIVIISHSRLCKAVAPKPEAERLAAKRATKASAWKKAHKDFMANLGCSVDFKPWTSLQEIELGGVSQTDRAKAILDCAWTERIRAGCWETFDAARVGYWADCHDSIPRRPWGTLPPLKQDQLLYSFQMDTVISGWASMKLHGWRNSVVLQDITDKDLRSMSGESFALPPITLIHFAFYRNPYADWW